MKTRSKVGEELGSSRIRPVDAPVADLGEPPLGVSGPTPRKELAKEL